MTKGSRGAHHSASRARIRKSLNAFHDMDNGALVQSWQQRIVESCTSTLGRELTAEEGRFITSRGGFLALEAIEDHVRSLAGQPDALVVYLNHER